MLRYELSRRKRSAPGPTRTIRAGLLAALCAFGPSAFAQQAATPDPATPQAAPGKPAPAPEPGHDGARKHEWQDGGPGGGRGPGGRDPGAEPASLEDVMRSMKFQAKALSGALHGSDRDASLAAVGEMERMLLLARQYEPNNMDTIAEADRPAHVIAYRKELLVALRQLIDIESHVLDGQYEAALEIAEGALLDTREAAHEQFKKQEEHRGGQGRGGGPGQHGGAAPKDVAPPAPTAPKGG